MFLRLGAVEGARPAAAVLFGGALAAAMLLGAQVLTTAHHAQEQGALRFLQSVWLTPSKRAVHFWPDPRA